MIPKNYFILNKCIKSEEHGTKLVPLLVSPDEDKLKDIRKLMEESDGKINLVTIRVPSLENIVCSNLVNIYNYTK